jgi:hypothetical protein
MARKGLLQGVEPDPAPSDHKNGAQPTAWQSRFHDQKNPILLSYVLVMLRDTTLLRNYCNMYALTHVPTLLSSLILLPHCCKLSRWKPAELVNEQCVLRRVLSSLARQRGPAELPDRTCSSHSHIILYALSRAKWFVVRGTISYYIYPAIMCATSSYLIRCAPFRMDTNGWYFRPQGDGLIHMSIGS